MKTVNDLKIIFHFIIFQMMIKKISILFVVILTTIATQKEIFIDYGIGGEGRELLRYFYDINDGFYVDIGAYDAIFASNTLNLYTQGWGGINIDANPQRLNRFFMMRPDQTNLNYAVGDADTFVTLYQLDQDSSSTVSPQVKQYVKSFKFVVNQIKVPGISLKQICERYYYRKPIFMNLDIEGYGSKALLSNDWTNDKCVPDIIFSEINEQTRQSGLELPEAILTRFGYKKNPLSVGLNQIYIHSKVYDKYIQKMKIADKYIDRLQLENIYPIENSLTTYLKTPTTVIKHYEPKQDNFYNKFTKFEEVIDLTKQNKRSNMLSPQKLNRPIIIYHFNSYSNLLVLTDETANQQFVLMDGYTFLQINVTKVDKSTYVVYVFDHRYEGQFKPKILYTKNAKQMDTNKTYTPGQKLDKPEILDPEQQLLISNIVQSIKQEVRKEEEMINKIGGQHANSSKDLRMMFSTYHNTEIGILEKIDEKLVKFEGKGDNKINANAQARANKNTDFDKDLENLSALVSVTLVIIGIMSTALCLTICCLYKKKSRRKQQRISGNQSAVSTHK